jgi:PKD repeat protein
MVFAFLALTSCGKTPFPCFTVSEKEDSIPVNKTVYFNAICSDKANEYFWTFPNDSLAYDEFVSYVFRDTGEAKVSLLVTNGNKTKMLTKKLLVVE